MRNAVEARVGRNVDAAAAAGIGLGLGRMVDDLRIGRGAAAGDRYVAVLGEVEIACAWNIAP